MFRKNFALQHLSSKVVQVDADSIAKFFAKSPSLPKAVLFSQNKRTSPLYKVSARLHRRRLGAD